MVMLDEPLFVSVTPCECVWPTVTGLKLWLVGFNATWAAGPPVPESVRVTAPPATSLAIVAVALKLPCASGENTTVKVALCPAPTVTGRLGVLNEKNLVEKEALVIITAASPEFVALTVTLLLVPALTVPKSRLELDQVRLPPADCCPLGLPVLTPWQPSNVTKARKAGMAVQRVAIILMGFESCFLSAPVFENRSVSVPGGPRFCKVPKGHTQKGRKGHEHVQLLESWS